jgi:hypothetical protein
MDSFRTEWHPAGAMQAALSHRDYVITAGSCFADRFGCRLRDNKFRVEINPPGVSYNPASIHRQLLQSLLGRPPDARHVVAREDQFVHLDYHSRFRHGSADQLLETIQHALRQVQADLHAASWLMLTYGTAWVHQYQPGGQIINNCQKIPARNFHRRLLKSDEIVHSFGELRQALKQANPNLKILLTLSPVRHLKDSLEGNAVSKAVLRAAIHEIQTAFPEVLYFPAYEIMMDDLRDYRFYEADLIHPNGQAEAYLWRKFAAAYFTADTSRLLAEWQSAHRALQHRPFEPGSPAHAGFLKQLLGQLENLQPLLPVEEEILSVRRQLEGQKSG